MWLIHSAKGQTWKKHKYIAIKNGRYIYPSKSKNSEGHGGGGGHFYTTGKPLSLQLQELKSRAYEKGQTSNPLVPGYSWAKATYEKFPKLGYNRSNQQGNSYDPPGDFIHIHKVQHPEKYTDITGNEGSRLYVGINAGRKRVNNELKKIGKKKIKHIKEFTGD